MSHRKYNILVISELYPNPVRPAYGIFIKKQTINLKDNCGNIVVLVPVRVFPHLSIWKSWKSPKKLIMEWKKWRQDLENIPLYHKEDGVEVFYVKYTSLPKQIFHSTWGYFAYPFLHRTLRRLQLDYSFDVIHAHYAVPSGTIALFAKKWLNLPVILSIHGSDITYTSRQNRLGAWVIKNILRSVDRIISNSDWTKRRIVKYGGEAKKVDIIRYGANPPQQINIDNACLGRENQEINILTVAYLGERKGHKYVIEAVHELIIEGYEIHYTIVGDGPELSSLQKQVKDLGMTNVVEFAGYKAHKDVWPYFQRCDLFVLPSWDEAFGIVYIEALSMGRPVVGCEGEGGPEDLKHLGDCISLAKARDTQSLVQVIRTLIDDPIRREQMGIIGQKVVKEHYDWGKSAFEMAKIYERVIEGNCD